MSPANPDVKKQYTQWVYPAPAGNLEASRSQGYYQRCDPSLFPDLIWPDRPVRSDISILVAGCGTSQSAMLAYTNPKASVTGIDLSPTSVKYTHELKQQHNLDNLELHCMDLLDVGTLGKKFDLIFSTGVLHHLPDPQEGLRKLSEVLAPDGVMCLMLYGKYLRAGVYMIQEALARMNIDQSPEGLAFTKTLIAALPRHHAVQSYIESAACDLIYDGGMVDTFLHKQDRAYTVDEVLKLVNDTNLSFQGWCDPIMYYPDAFIPYDHPVAKVLFSLPDEEQWSVMELIMQRIGAHGFFVRHKAEDESSFRIDFNGPAFLKTTPSLRHGSTVKNENNVVLFQREGNTVSLGALEQFLLKAVNGKTSVEKIISTCTNASPEQHEQALRFFKCMGRLGHFVYSTHIKG